MKHKGKSPVRQYRVIVQDSNDPGYVNRLLVGIPTTGLVRIEWHAAFMSLVTPVNWSRVTMTQYLNTFIPLRYQVADAQNLIVKQAVERDFEWLLLYEHDVLPPPDALMRLNRYMTQEKTPVVSGLYYTRSMPADPLVFRGRGTGAFVDWKMGEPVWCDGAPTGFLLIHCAILRAMWAESAEYPVGSEITRRVFDTPRNLWLDPTTAQFNMNVGTSDLDWCTRVMQGRFFEKAGWHKYQAMEYPFLVDTGMFCRHIDVDGRQYP
jgi:hypothetical protein